MKLYLDTSDNLKTVVRIDDQEFLKTYSSPRDQDVLGAIKAALEESGREIREVTEIEVNQGPGSFTGLRVGVSVANALGFGLKVPVNGRPIGKLTEPEYGKLPNISFPK